MEIITTNKFDLEPLALPFGYSFVTRPNADRKTAWFTPSGKAKIWFGRLDIKTIGTVTDEDFKKFSKEMKKVKADVLWDTKKPWLSDKRYTFADGKLVECSQMRGILIVLQTEWDNRQEFEGWESL